MTEEMRQAIEHACARLVTSYANLNDAARWHNVANLYVKDGRMARPTAPGQWIEGRAAILEAFLARPPRKTRHFCSNIVIDVLSEREAVGESAMLLFTGEAQPKIGSFHDRFVLSDEGWRFAERCGSLTF